jgi:putative endonuclease
MGAENYPPNVKSEEGEDWKKRLKALGISRKRGKRKEEDLLRKVKRGGPDLQRVESGRRGEDLASLLLEENSLQILDRNVRFKDGELDIVALDGATTVFVEVKRRRSDALGSPAEAVTRTKRLRVVRAARRWLAAHPSRSRAVRFDVVAVADEPASVTWIKDAFGGDAGA